MTLRKSHAFLIMFAVAAVMAVGPLLAHTAGADPLEKGEVCGWTTEGDETFVMRMKDTEDEDDTGLICAVVLDRNGNIAGLVPVSAQSENPLEDAAEIIEARYYPSPTPFPEVQFMDSTPTPTPVPPLTPMYWEESDCYPNNYASNCRTHEMWKAEDNNCRRYGTVHGHNSIGGSSYYRCATKDYRTNLGDGEKYAPRRFRPHGHTDDSDNGGYRHSHN